MQLTEAVDHVEDRKMTFEKLCNYAGYAIIRYAIKRVRLYRQTCGYGVSTGKPVCTGEYG